MKSFKEQLVHIVQGSLFIQVWILSVWLLLGVAKIVIYTVSFRKAIAASGRFYWCCPMGSAVVGRERE